MNRTLAALILLSAMKPASGHRLDEYLQATILRVEKDRVQVEMVLTPGVAVSPVVLADIDTNADGAISAAEQRAYAERVLHDMSLNMDGSSLRPRLVSSRFAGLEELKEGRGAIELELTAPVTNGGRERKLICENHHKPSISAYLANTLVPRDPEIQITAQKRNYQQSLYELDYKQPPAAEQPISPWWSLLLAPLALTWRLRARTRVPPHSPQSGACRSRAACGSAGSAHLPTIEPYEH